jgi:hypothetical protein
MVVLTDTSAPPGVDQDYFNALPAEDRQAIWLGVQDRSRAQQAATSPRNQAGSPTGGETASYGKMAAHRWRQRSLSQSMSREIALEEPVFGVFSDGGVTLKWEVQPCAGAGRHQQNAKQVQWSISNWGEVDAQGRPVSVKISLCEIFASPDMPAMQGTIPDGISASALYDNGQPGGESAPVVGPGEEQVIMVYKDDLRQPAAAPWGLPADLFEVTGPYVATDDAPVFSDDGLEWKACTLGPADVGSLVLRRVGKLPNPAGGGGCLWLCLGKEGPAGRSPRSGRGVYSGAQQRRLGVDRDGRPRGRDVEYAGGFDDEPAPGSGCTAFAGRVWVDSGPAGSGGFDCDRLPGVGDDEGAPAGCPSAGGGCPSALTPLGWKRYIWFAMRFEWTHCRGAKTQTQTQTQTQAEAERSMVQTQTQTQSQWGERARLGRTLSNADGPETPRGGGGGEGGAGTFGSGQKEQYARLAACMRAMDPRFLSSTFQLDLPSRYTTTLSISILSISILSRYRGRGGMHTTNDRALCRGPPGSWFSLLHCFADCCFNNTADTSNRTLPRLHAPVLHLRIQACRTRPATLGTATCPPPRPAAGAHSTTIF